MQHKRKLSGCNTGCKPIWAGMEGRDTMGSTGPIARPETGMNSEGSALPLMMQLQQPIEFTYRNDSPMPGAQFHSHAFYEMYYFQEGECNYLIGDKLMTLHPGDFILMHGMTLHCPNPSPEKP